MTKATRQQLENIDDKYIILFPGNDIHNKSLKYNRMLRERAGYQFNEEGDLVEQFDPKKENTVKQMIEKDISNMQKEDLAKLYIILREPTPHKDRIFSGTSGNRETFQYVNKQLDQAPVSQNDILQKKFELGIIPEKVPDLIESLRQNIKKLSAARPILEFDLNQQKLTLEGELEGAVSDLKDGDPSNISHIINTIHSFIDHELPKIENHIQEQENKSSILSFFRQFSGKNTLSQIKVDIAKQAAHDTRLNFSELKQHIPENTIPEQAHSSPKPGS